MLAASGHLVVIYRGDDNKIELSSIVKRISDAEELHKLVIVWTGDYKYSTENLLEIIKDESFVQRRGIDGIVSINTSNSSLELMTVQNVGEKFLPTILLIRRQTEASLLASILERLDKKRFKFVFFGDDHRVEKDGYYDDEITKVLINYLDYIHVR